MRICKITGKAVLALLIAAAMVTGLCASQSEVFGASGKVKTCVINRCYRHPVSGEIEDSGGEASFATGQGMVEGCVYNKGIIETTDGGRSYLTIRMGLADFSSGQSFSVQSRGESGWTSVKAVKTGTGSDTNGTTKDFCIPVPSEDCVVRGTMFVDPMGRDVIFYLYPSDFRAGNHTDMNVTKVSLSEEEKAEGGGAMEEPQKNDKQENEISQENKVSKEEKKDKDKKDSKKDKKTDISKEQEMPDVEKVSLGTEKGLTLSTESPASQSQEASENSKTVFLVIGGILALIIIAGGAGLYIKKKKEMAGDRRDDEEY